MQTLLKDLFDMQERAFNMKEEFQDMLYLEFSNNFLYFFKVCSINTESQALMEFGMSMRQFRSFRRRILRILESVRQAFNVYMRHITKRREMRIAFGKLDQCAKKLVILRSTPTRKHRIRNLQSAV